MNSLDCEVTTNENHRADGEFVGRFAIELAKFVKEPRVSGGGGFVARVGNRGQQHDF
jgi:hypothetical protein